ncbi:MAG: pseudouridine synthase, partial [Thiogranum sp.]
MQPYNPPPDTGLALIYQDDALLVLDKPSGLLSVPGRGADKQDSLLTRARHRFADAECVHRLDMETSGLMLFALGKRVQRMLNGLFQQRRIGK